MTKKVKMVTPEEEELMRKAAQEQAEGKVEFSAEKGKLGDFPNMPMLEPEDKMNPEESMKKIQELCAQISSTPPTLVDLQGWKRIHGDLFVVQPDENQIYIYRYIKRQEWKQILAENPPDRMSNDAFDEEIFKRCLLWPRFTVEQLAFLPAGIIPTLSQQIQAASGWLNPQALAQITIKI